MNILNKTFIKNIGYIIFLISIILTLTTCDMGGFGNSGGNGTIRISTGDSARAVMPWPDTDTNMLNKMDYVFTMTGNGSTITFTTKGGNTITRSVRVGNYNIEVKAYLQGQETPLTPNGERMHYATDNKSVEVKEGQTTQVTMDMKAEFCKVCNYGQIIPATCTTTSTVSINCSIPTHNGITTIAPVLGHNWQWFVTTPPNFGTSTEGVETERCNRCSVTNGTRPYPILEIGDTGPAGGIIFYFAPNGFTVEGYGSLGDNGYFSTYTAYYLEAAPVNEGIMLWANLAFLNNGVGTHTGIVIGTGRSNTAMIVAAIGTNAPAAYRCSIANHGSKNDWFLPSTNELIQLRTVKDLVDVTTGVYHTSTEASAGSNNMNVINFDITTVGNNAKTSNYNVRAIRAFYF